MATDPSQNKLFRVAGQLAATLCSQKRKVTVAESCTGGGIAHVLTSISGASQWFECGFITYSNRAKSQLLKVDTAVLEQFGAVSNEVVAQMARGALQESGADYAVAVSGVAGPSGGTEAKPVGTVWLAWACVDHVQATCFHFEGDREAVRDQAIYEAICGLLRVALSKAS